MAEQRKPFLTTVPGMISGIAATVTGLAVLIPLALGAAGKNPRHNVSSTQASPNPSGSATTTVTPSDTSSPGVNDTSSAGPGTGDTSSPSTNSPSAGSTGVANLSAQPATVSFGSVASGKSSQDVNVTINNSGGPATIASVGITGQNQGAFSITGTTCGTGSTVPGGGSCTVTLRFSPPSVGTDTGRLEVYYSPPDSAFMSLNLNGTGSLL